MSTVKIRIYSAFFCTFAAGINEKIENINVWQK